ncbi:ATP-grasp domain-containing protein [Maricaulis sp.]|uniref:ATP-binding protein n=1 Tax=Maricaulis sp. TaxID=1486257 RepID=UPI002623F760|nr:ATP-grasp domain-containing protein [Maricaulis sp.]
MAKLFLIGNHRPSFALARTLHRQGHEIWAGHNGYSDYFERSNSVTGSLPIPDFANESACIRSIAEYCEDYGFDIVVPVTDRATRLLAGYRAALPKSVTVMSPDPDIVARCVSKTRMAELCRTEKVPVADYLPVANLSQLKRACESLGYPLVVKPTGEGQFVFGHKVITLDSPADLDREFAAWPAEHAHLLVQRRLSGNRINHYFVAWGGDILTACAIEVERTDRADGSGYAVEGISITPRPDLVDQTEALVEALNYTGVGCAQFMTARDSDQTSFLEINPRLGANIAGAEAAGADIAKTLLDLTLGRDIALSEEPWSHARTGVRYHWAKGDFSGWVWRLRQGAGLGASLAGALRILRGMIRSNVDLVFSWRDPVPGLACWFHPVLRRLRNRKDAGQRGVKAPN